LVSPSPQINLPNMASAIATTISSVGSHLYLSKYRFLANLCRESITRLTYNAARVMVSKAGKAVGIHLRPHDLRRFCATYASRAGTPIEIISKILLRHVHLSTTQRYLGKISDTEALKWIENLYG